MLLRLIRWLTFGLIVLVIMLRLYEHVFTGDQATTLESARFALFDSFQGFKPRESQEHPGEVVDIDEESLRRLGPWPWPRQHLTKLINNISAMGASTIVIYLSLADTDTMSPQRIAKLLPPDDAFASAGISLQRCAALDCMQQQFVGLASAGAARRSGEKSDACTLCTCTCHMHMHMHMNMHMHMLDVKHVLFACKQVGCRYRQYSSCFQ